MKLPAVGTLYNPKGDAPFGNLPPFWTQPGGPGTRVFPQATDSAIGQFEPPMSPVGMYVPGCGHPINCWAIYKQHDDDTGLEMAMICCPACTYIQMIIPYDRYDDYLQTPIVIG